MSTLVLDTGALIAVERFDRSMWAILSEAQERGTETVVPTSVLAEAWRGEPPPLLNREGLRALADADARIPLIEI